MFLVVLASVMVPFFSSHPLGPPLLRRVQGAFPFPDFSAPMQSSDSHFPSASAPVCPCLRPTSGRVLLLSRHSRASRLRDDVGQLVPVLRKTGFLRGVRGPPRFLGRPDVARAVVVHPARSQAALAHFGRLDVTFEEFSTLGTWNVIDFVAAFPTAHALVCLRFAGHVTASVARLTTGSVSSPLARRAFHPLDDLQDFSNSLLHSIPLDQHCLVALKGLCVPWARS